MIIKLSLKQFEYDVYTVIFKEILLVLQMTTKRDKTDSPRFQVAKHNLRKTNVLYVLILQFKIMCCSRKLRLKHSLAPGLSGSACTT